MKTLLTLPVCMVLSAISAAQITSPQIKANFGIDADLRGNFVVTTSTITTDDWFVNGGAGTGKFVIDTTGAAALYNTYITNPSTRNQSVIRNMSVPPFSVVNARTLIDAVFVRDFHGDDSTIFASGSNKNGMSPAEWSTPESQSVPDKNEILDIYMHVRRDGRGADSLWMFGAVSIENTNGNRYFDFEMFQTDIFYNRTSNTFSGYGPDAGHTAWQFDAAGNIIKAGDIILTAEYSSSSLTMIEARIWVDRSAIAVNPVAFKWSGLFDGAGSGSQFGYASILPKTEGAFYSGLQNAGTSWGGSFKVVRNDNSIVNDYITGQFMEFSVNLTKLGLDPVTVLGGSTCDMPFQKVMVKTRASTSFTAALKDFVAPFKPLTVAKADLFTLVPVFCGMNSVSNIKVNNAIATSVYTWQTLDGHFTDTSNKTSVYVDQPGTYIVHQKLQAACPVFATDTISIRFDPDCGILSSSKLALSASLQPGRNVLVKWKALKDEPVASYTIERSSNGAYYTPVKTIEATQADTYTATDALLQYNRSVIYYRLAVRIIGGGTRYSPPVVINLSQAGTKNMITLVPNPIVDHLQMQVYSASAQQAKFTIMDAKGNLVVSSTKQLDKGSTTITIDGFANKPVGIYTVKIEMNDEVQVKRFMIAR